ncbi:MAG: M23 family metallopeptidase [Rickettsiales bacterium]|nr:M23 family metallopeptidase [Rickettsiales bacterium]
MKSFSKPVIPQEKLATLAVKEDLFDDLDSSESTDLSWPLPAETTKKISSGYGNRIHPISGLRRFHDGIDIAAAPDTKVLATHDGTILEAGRQRKLGNFIRIAHADGMISTYGHLSHILVKKGHKVDAGDTIGKLGSTGYSTGPHLHYGLKRDEKSINPMQQLAEVSPFKKVEVASKDD